jgi:hypothetical protein
VCYGSCTWGGVLNYKWNAHLSSSTVGNVKISRTECIYFIPHYNFFLFSHNFYSHLFSGLLVLVLGEWGPCFRLQRKRFILFSQLLFLWSYLLQKKILYVLIFQQIVLFWKNVLLLYVIWVCCVGLVILLCSIWSRCLLNFLW